jgi:threonylcarbamoyladenosine tRNA methylthiotransferase MtaB
VLFEESKQIQGKKYQLGHTVDYVKVALETEEDLVNQIRNVKVKGFLTDDILF